MPAASAWCDLVMIGKGKDNQKQVVIIELKNWVKNETDAPGLKEGLITHQGVQHLHPADQVRGYTEYCQSFHSAVQEEGAKVSGCVYFTKDIDLAPYEESPNETLTKEYPLYNTSKTDALADYVIKRIEKSDEDFAVKFVNGYYKQDRNILRQVAKSFDASNARPFVLLDEQRKGFNLVMNEVEKNYYEKTGKKLVFIVSGPPGSGKSAVAVNLWFESVLKFTEREDVGSVVYVTTSESQNHNWTKIFADVAGKKKAKNIVVKASSYSPGMDIRNVNDYLEIFENLPEGKKYVGQKSTGERTLKKEYFEDYTNYMLEHGKAKNYKDNLYFMSVVDEAHALINPLAEGFSMAQGWCNQMGPQAYHIIRESQISVFLTDEKQSFRDRETTNIADIERWAKHLDAEIIRVSLEGMQFRCAGSKEYVDWVECLFSKTPLRNVKQWSDKFHLSVVDYPSEMEEFLRGKIEKGDKSVRILSSYSENWRSKKTLKADHTQEEAYDFILGDKDGRQFKKYWNNPQGYDIFVQATEGTKMSKDPLSEVGCPYVIRGFDYNYIGLLWLDDVVRRGDKWMVNFEHAKETANNLTKTRALGEQRRYERSLGLPARTIELVEGDNDDFPCTQAFFQTIAQAYRIVLTRAVKGVCIYIKDEETRKYVCSLLKQE